MEKHYSLIHADIILDALFKSPLKDKDITVECWANCREQGYHLIDYKNEKALNFAQQRNSDSIVIVAGSSRHDFDTSTNSPSDSAWEKGRVELYPDEKATDYIVCYFSRASGEGAN